MTAPCPTCSHYDLRDRWCTLAGEEVRNPTAGPCRYYSGPPSEDEEQREEEEDGVTEIERLRAELAALRRERDEKFATYNDTRCRALRLEATIADLEGEPEQAAWLRSITDGTSSEESDRLYVRAQAAYCLRAGLDPETHYTALAPAIRDEMERQRAERSGS